MRYLKENWPHLLVSMLGSAFSTAFALGFAWATLGYRIANAERQLEQIDHARVAETRWQVEQNTSAIAALRIDAHQTEVSIGQINTRLGVIDAKLDAIAETLKKR